MHHRCYSPHPLPILRTNQYSPHSAQAATSSERGCVQRTSRSNPGHQPHQKIPLPPPQSKTTAPKIHQALNLSRRPINSRANW